MPILFIIIFNGVCFVRIYPLRLWGFINWFKDIHLRLLKYKINEIRFMS
jgi:hypothetical protein